MFEKEKKQYEEDSKNYERPWELWEYKIIGRDAYTDAAHHPHWLPGYHYRRKQTIFMPEYYSGINWRNAEHLVGKTVECTNNPDAGWSSGILMLFDTVSDDTYYKFTVKKQDSLLNRIYIRTCEETFKHHPISIGGVELPMPETVAPSHGTKYWTFPGCICHIWNGFTREMDFLKAGQVHLTEDNAKAWADWWKTTVIDKMK